MELLPMLSRTCVVPTGSTDIRRDTVGRVESVEAAKAVEAVEDAAAEGAAEEAVEEKEAAEEV